MINYTLKEFLFEGVFIYECLTHGSFIVDKNKLENFKISKCGCCKDMFICPDCINILDDSHGFHKFCENENILKCLNCLHLFESDDEINSGMADCGCCGPYPCCPKCDNGHY